MCVIVGAETRAIIQGITGTIGRRFADRMVTEGDTALVGGVTPGRAGEIVSGARVYDTVREAREATGANASLLLVPPQAALGAAVEAMEAGIETLVLYIGGVPVHDAVTIMSNARRYNSRVIGPSAGGIASPGKANLSELANSILRQGQIGVISKSATLTYDLLEWLSLEGPGISTVACLGGDLVTCTSMSVVLEAMAHDEHTLGVVLLGEIGGHGEFECARVIREMDKPVYAYVNGAFAPREKPMGHAGAIQSRYEDGADAKREVLSAAGAIVVELRSDLVPAIAGRFGG